jgi:hypothetical protein
MYLEMLTEFSPFQSIASVVKKFTSKFLRLSGLFSGEKRELNKKKRPRSSSSLAAASVSSLRTKGSSSSKYLEHSLPVGNLLAAAGVGSSSNSFRASSRATTEIVEDIEAEQEKSDFVTWWDPNMQQTFYIDPRTGNS